MKQERESGHAVNIENFGFMIAVCENFGSGYSPWSAEISISSMKAKHAEVKQLQEDYMISLMSCKDPINRRAEMFRKMRILTLRALNMYKCVNGADAGYKDIKYLAVLISGSNTRKPKQVKESGAKWISRSHLSYDMLMDHFDKLTSFLNVQPEYNPNEYELSKAGLMAFKEELTALNSLTEGLKAEVVMKRIARNRAMYDSEHGMTEVARKCRSYVKGRYGARSPEARMLTGIKIRQI